MNVDKWKSYGEEAGEWKGEPVVLLENENSIEVCSMKEGSAGALTDRLGVQYSDQS